MQFDAAVAIVTVCRDSLLRAVDSVFAQSFAGRVQVLVGVDVDPGGRSQALYDQLVARCPANRTLTWLNLGYSTSQRHGGVHASHYGGSLRTILSFCAASARVAYLDDDDWWAPDHLDAIVRAIDGRKWAYSLCWYADPDRATALCEDGIESVGPGLGIYAERFGGFVRPSALMIDKVALPDALPLWSMAPFSGGDGEDRLVFERLRREPAHGATGRLTVYAALDPRDDNHAVRRAYIESRGVAMPAIAKPDSTRARRAAG
ncbi:MAG TPA: hypothetical protein VMU33_11830 [Burkholderiaceae bacterium]|nr:hypothetical protein [Burkholderiaceae bacterium]